MSFGPFRQNRTRKVNQRLRRLRRFFGVWVEMGGGLDVEGYQRSRRFFVIGGHADWVEVE
jgi:hypothetical protein